MSNDRRNGSHRWLLDHSGKKRCLECHGVWPNKCFPVKASGYRSRICTRCTETKRLWAYAHAEEPETPIQAAVRAFAALW